MDEQLRQLKRATLSSPDDVSVLHHYINSLERVVGGVEPSPAPSVRQGWKCEQSPDSVCIYFSMDHILCERYPGEGPCGPGCHRVVLLMIDGKKVEHPLAPTYAGENESEDWCIFCGEPEERK